MTSVGPITVRLGEGKPAGGEESPSCSAVYRNSAAQDGALPDTANGCTTLYELFDRAVQEHGDNRSVFAAHRPLGASPRT